MLADRQVRKLMTLLSQGEPLYRAALKTGIEESTARKYRQAGQLPSELKQPHPWRTRADPFADVWEELRGLLAINPGLQATTLFAHLQRRSPGRFPDGQLRCLQRRLKQWRATEGPPKEVFFPQTHHAGELCASDFCHLSRLGVTIAGQPFAHLLYHFVLTYSNWETGTICFAESFESLSAGLQSALFELGGVPKRHRTDCLSAAVRRPTPDGGREFTAAYQGLLSHYGLQAERTNPGRANENGDVEQRHHRFMTALDQALMLRGSRDFASRQEYGVFLGSLFAQLNAGCKARFAEELAQLGPLPAARLSACKRLRMRVGPASTISVQNNTYSVHSRLIGEWVEVRLFAEHLELWYGQRPVEQFPRLRGRRQHRIDYRHVIDWLVRKPGAFANYRYRDDLFPTSRFRMAYDALTAQAPGNAAREYLALLQLAARGSESRVDAALRVLLEREAPVRGATVEALLQTAAPAPVTATVCIAPVNLAHYDGLLGAAAALAEPTREAA